MLYINPELCNRNSQICTNHLQNKRIAFCEAKMFPENKRIAFCEAKMFPENKRIAFCEAKMFPEIGNSPKFLE